MTLSKKSNVSQKDMDLVYVLLSMSKHIQECMECAQKQCDIMNHGKIPIPEHLRGEIDDIRGKM